LIVDLRLELDGKVPQAADAVIASSTLVGIVYEKMKADQRSAAIDEYLG
jgi:hypothetical protein